MAVAQRAVLSGQIWRSCEGLLGLRVEEMVNGKAGYVRFCPSKMTSEDHGTDSLFVEMERM